MADFKCLGFMHLHKSQAHGFWESAVEQRESTASLSEPMEIGSPGRDSIYRDTAG